MNRVGQDFSVRFAFKNDHAEISLGAGGARVAEQLVHRWSTATVGLHGLLLYYLHLDNQEVLARVFCLIALLRACRLVTILYAR